MYKDKEVKKNVKNIFLYFVITLILYIWQKNVAGPCWPSDQPM
jgi:hypothetical protein